MRNYYYIFILSFLACQESKNGNNTQIEDVISDHEISEKQVRLIFENIKELPVNTQVSFGFIDNGSVKFYGIKIDSDSVISITNHQKVFEIGSITKVFTATLLAQYVMEGKVSLEDDVMDHLDFKIKGNPRISLKQLSNHTSGLPRLPSNLETGLFDPENPYQAYNQKYLMEYLLEEIELEQTLKEQYFYSNLGAGLLGFALQNVEGKNYEELVQQKIFSKYGMIQSTTQRKLVEHLLINGLDENGKVTSNWDLSVLVGAGGALSSADDLSKFILAHFDSSNEELNLTRNKTFTINRISAMGLGWEIINRRSGDTWYKHNGGTGGYSSSLIMDVNNKNGIIILSNVSAYNRKRSIIDDWSFELMKSIYQ